ncbi:MAG: nuclear transport factor 2 family protein [Deltaproteobacteria bacterium]|nr:nuclear transport factor 2 family protein [Deltaproteobacteria bacterium]
MSRQAILAANEAFYEAFAQRDLEAMDLVWAEQAPVACIHPGWDVLLGREQVMAAWDAILSSPSAPKIVCSHESIHVCGDAAYVVCRETAGEGTLIATNLFVLENGRWRLAHHQAGPLAETDDEEDDEDSDGEPTLLN